MQGGERAEQHQAAGICRAPYKQAKKYQDEEMAGVYTLLPAQLPKKKKTYIFMNPRPIVN